MASASRTRGARPSYSGSVRLWAGTFAVGRRHARRRQQDQESIPAQSRIGNRRWAHGEARWQVIPRLVEQAKLLRLREAVRRPELARHAPARRRAARSVRAARGAGAAAGLAQFWRSLDERRELDVDSGRCKSRVDTSEQPPRRLSDNGTRLGLLLRLRFWLGPRLGFAPFLYLSVLKQSRDIWQLDKLVEGYLHRAPLYHHYTVVRSWHSRRRPPPRRAQIPTVLMASVLTCSRPSPRRSHRTARSPASRRLRRSRRLTIPGRCCCGRRPAAAASSAVSPTRSTACCCRRPAAAPLPVVAVVR